MVLKASWEKAVVVIIPSSWGKKDAGWLALDLAFSRLHHALQIKMTCTFLWPVPTLKVSHFNGTA